MGKATNGTPLPGYRDDPIHDGTASASSALLLGDIEYNDEDLPSYSEVNHLQEESAVVAEEPSPYLLPNEIAGACLSNDESTRFTIYPYSLEALIREELKYPPQYYIRIHGTHTETHRTGKNKTEKRNITDFDFKLNMTQLLICKIPSHQSDPTKCYEATADNPMPCRYIYKLPDGEKGYRGGIFPRRTPSPSSADPEHDPPRDAIEAWVQAYQSNRHKTKSFTFNKVVTHHNTEYLKSAIENLIKNTAYRGHVKVSFPLTHSSVKVFSRSRLNVLRFNKYVCWFFWLTFLWLLSWPLILLAERKYKPITIYYPYVYLPYDPTLPRDQARPHVQPGNQRASRPLVETEQRFWSEWNTSVKRAVLDKHQGWIDGYYRAETEELARRPNGLPSMGHAFADGVVGNVAALARGVHNLVGWGADS